MNTQKDAVNLMNIAASKLNTQEGEGICLNLDHDALILLNSMCVSSQDTPSKIVSQAIRQFYFQNVQRSFSNEN